MITIDRDHHDLDDEDEANVTITKAYQSITYSSDPKTEHDLNQFSTILLVSSEMRTDEGVVKPICYSSFVDLKVMENMDLGYIKDISDSKLIIEVKPIIN